jgi:amidase
MRTLRVVLGAGELAERIAAREVSCVEVMRDHLERIERHNPELNAIVSLREPGELLAEAAGRDAELARGEPRGWMHGLPHAVKDLEDAAGIPTVAGSPLQRDNVPAADSPLVARIKAAGAIVIGKTNVPEFGFGAQTYNPVFGPTRNPYDTTRTPGGSSGGAAAALAAGLLPVADGSDYIGSLRNPAAFCNVYGFRPSIGRVAALPTTTAFLPATGTAGAMGRSPADVARLMATIAGPAPELPFSIHEDPAAFAEPLRPLERASVAWLGDLGGHLAMEPGILELCERALADSPFDVEAAEPGFDPERVWQAAVTLRFFDAAWLLDLDESALKPELRYEAEGARRVTGREVFEAHGVRTQLFEALRALLERHDLVALPSAQVFPFDVQTHWPGEIAGRRMDTYHRWMEVVAYASLAGLPAISVPAGFRDGVPMGLQLIGRPRGDLAVLRAAHAYDQATGWVERCPP